MSAWEARSKHCTASQNLQASCNHMSCTLEQLRCCLPAHTTERVRARALPTSTHNARSLGARWSYTRRETLGSFVGILEGLLQVRSVPAALHGMVLSALPLPSAGCVLESCLRTPC